MKLGAISVLQLCMPPGQWHNHLLCLSHGPRVVLAVQRNKGPQHGVILAQWQCWILLRLASMQARKAKLMVTTIAPNLLQCMQVMFKMYL